MTRNAVIPALTPEGSLSRYMEQIRAFPMLEADEEYMLARSFAERGDVDAAHKLVTSHLRLVAKIAMGYRGYGLPVSDLISEGNVGLMQGVKKFEADRGFRLATYAMWWIKASIQEYILRSWSLVKMGTTAAQKKLFFNLRRMKKNLDAYEDTDLHPDDVTKIATDLGVPEQEVINMNRRMIMGGDGSLNTPMRNGEEGSGEWQDWLSDDGPLQDELVADAQESEVRHDMLVEAMDSLNDREKHILTERRLTENPQTLEELHALKFPTSIFDSELGRAVSIRIFVAVDFATVPLSVRALCCVVVSVGLVELSLNSSSSVEIVRALLRLTVRILIVTTGVTPGVGAAIFLTVASELRAVEPN